MTCRRQQYKEKEHINKMNVERKQTYKENERIEEANVKSK